MKTVYILFYVPFLLGLCNCMHTHKRTLFRSDDHNIMSTENSMHHRNSKSIRSSTRYYRKINDSSKVDGKVDRNIYNHTNKIKLQENQQMKQKSIHNCHNRMKLLTTSNHPEDQNCNESMSTINDNENKTENDRSTKQQNKCNWYDHIKSHIKRMDRMNGLKSLYNSIIYRNSLKNDSSTGDPEIYSRFAKYNIDPVNDFDGDQLKTTTSYNLKGYLDGFEDVSSKPIMKSVHHTGIERIYLKNTKRSTVENKSKRTGNETVSETLKKHRIRHKGKTTGSKKLTRTQSYVNNTPKPRMKITRLISGSVMSKRTSNVTVVTVPSSSSVEPLNTSTCTSTDDDNNFLNSKSTITVSAAQFTVNNIPKLKKPSKTRVCVPRIKHVTVGHAYKVTHVDKKNTPPTKKVNDSENSIPTLLVVVTQAPAKYMKQIQTNPVINVYGTKKLEHQSINDKLVKPFYIISAEQLNMLLSNFNKCPHCSNVPINPEITVSSDIKNYISKQTTQPYEYLERSTVQRPIKNTTTTCRYVIVTVPQSDTIDLSNNNLLITDTYESHIGVKKEIVEKPLSKIQYFIVYPHPELDQHRPHNPQNMLIPNYKNQVIPSDSVEFNLHPHIYSPTVTLSHDVYTPLDYNNQIVTPPNPYYAELIWLNGSKYPVPLNTVFIK